MKAIKYFVAIVLVCSFSSGLSVRAQESKSVEQKTSLVKVWGNCDMCKTRIEKAAKEEGATIASWDKETKMLKVTFNPDTTSVDRIEKKLALVGHDTERYRADDKTYNSLPACCKYERRK
jgi:mercuric ion binding protein